MKLLYLMLLLNAAQIHAEEIIVEVVSVYDGDTFRVNIPEWPDIIGLNMPIRVKGIDTPEIRGKCSKEKELAKKARLYTTELLMNAKRVSIIDIERGKYFRFIANVHMDGMNLSELLLLSGDAILYSERKKHSWCI